MAKYKLVIFDWDGTLMDTVERIVTSLQAAAKTISLTPPSLEEGKSIIGLSLYNVVRQLYPDTTDHIRRKFEQEYKHQYLHVNNTPTPLFNNALSLLIRLKEHDVLIAVATGKAREGLNRVLKVSDTKYLFDATRTASECESKPDPDMITSLLAELNVEAADAVMIGDTSFDMEMAKNANVDRIGVTLGAHSEEVLNRYEPIAIVHSFTELEQILIPI